MRAGKAPTAVASARELLLADATIAPDGRLAIIDMGANLVRILPAGQYQPTSSPRWGRRCPQGG